MAVPSVNIRIDKGTDFSAKFNLTNADASVYDLANYTATAKISKHPRSSTSKSFTTSVVTGTGEITISMSDTDTATLKEGLNYYNVLITHSTNGTVTKVFEGNATVIDSIS
jgi:hypothetical protein